MNNLKDIEQRIKVIEKKIIKLLSYIEDLDYDQGGKLNEAESQLDMLREESNMLHAELESKYYR